MDKKIVIFGGTSGIGLQTAIRLSGAFDVYATGRDEKKISGLRDQYSEIHFHRVDSTNESALTAFMKEVGKISHIVLALGGSKGAGPFKELQVSTLEQGFSEKFLSQIKSLKSALPYLSSDGSVTFVSGASAQMADPGTSGLAAINGAIEAMVRPLAVELAPMRINAVTPGLVDTPWWDFLNPEQKGGVFKQYAQRATVGRVAKPDDIAQAIESLILNTFITGVILTCDGGLRLGSKLS